MDFNKRFFEDVELQCMGYEAPIKKIYTDIQNKLIEDEKKMTLQAVQNVGIDVDKEELLKALKYDRNQYEKGYKQAIIDFIVECQKAFPLNSDGELVLGGYSKELGLDDIYRVARKLRGDFDEL